MTMLLPLDSEEGDDIGGIIASAASLIQDAEYLYESDVIPLSRFKQIKEAVSEDLELELRLEFDDDDE